MAYEQRRRGDTSDNTYQVRPEHKDKFPVERVREIMKAVLESKLLNEDGSPVPYSAEYTKELAEQIRDELRDLKLPRYKIMVQVVVGQQRGAGVRMGSRCLWDSITDNKASETLVNDNLFAVATAYGVYLY